MNLDLNGKTALVTGSSGGIGLEIGRSLAAEGAQVIISGRTQRQVEKAVADVRAGLPKAELVALVADNGNTAGCGKTISLFSEAERRFMSENRPTSLIGRLISPKEIGDIVAFLCSARASIINGSCIRAEGGLVRSVF